MRQEDPTVTFSYILLAVLLPSLLLNGWLVNREYGRWQWKRKQARKRRQDQEAAATLSQVRPRKTSRQ